MRNLPKITSHLLLALLTVFCLLFTLAHSVQAIDLTKYFFPTGGPGNNMSTGEFFKVIEEPDGYFRIQKSVDHRYYERFRVQNGKIYHVEEATWATEQGNVKCTDSGNEASARYVGGQTEWVNVNVSVGEKIPSAGGKVVGWDKVLQRECPTPYSGDFGAREMEVTHQGCLTFPNGVTSDDAIVLKINAGPGAGEQFAYDANRGWMGFSRAEGKNGAYVTDDLSTTTHAPGQCAQFEVSTSSRSKCPAGITCPSTPATGIKGEVFEVTKSLPKFSDPKSALRGETGPDPNQFNFPNISQEDEYFNTSEFFDRALPADLRQLLRISPVPFLAQIGHPGCGKVIADGQDVGYAQTDSQISEFSTPDSYNNSLLTTRFWQSIFVPGQGTNLRISSYQPDFPDPAQGYTDCENNTGRILEAAVIQGVKSTPLGVIGDFLTGVGNLLSSLQCVVSQTTTFGKCTIDVKVAVQQEKFIPGEEAFYKQTVGETGFLNIHKLTDFAYEKTQSERDESEISPYSVLGVKQSEGTPVLGMASYQEETLNFIKSMYPEELAKDITSIETAPQTTSQIDTQISQSTDYEITFDSQVKVADIQKQKVIRLVKTRFPDSKIDTLWDTVYSKASASGINPALAIAVWIGESRASAPSANGNHFSCPPKGNRDFNDNFQCFINTTN